MPTRIVDNGIGAEQVVVSQSPQKHKPLTQPHFNGSLNMAINEANLSALIENTSDLILSLDRQGRIQVINTSFIQFAQALWSLELSRGASFQEVLTRENKWKSWVELALSGTSFKEETCYELEIGPLFLELSFNPIRDHEGVRGVSVFGKDITDQHKVLAQIHAQEQLLTSINYSIQEGIFRSSPTDGILYVNKAFAEMFGYSSEEEVMQLEPYALYHDTHRRDDFVRIMQTESSFINEEVEFKRKDGSTFYGLISSIKSHGSQGEVFYDGAIRDVTELRRKERQVEEQNTELIKVNKELDAFVYRTSHDLRAPLLSIQGLINILRMSESPEEQLAYLDLMASSVNKLDSFILEITNYSRNARMEVKAQAIDFDKLVKDAYEQIRFLPNQNGFNHSLTIEGLDTFYSDPLRLGMIFNNLISNAVRYRDPQKTDSFLRIHIKGKDDVAHITFEDNGQGIAEKHLKRIFEMFFRGNQKSEGSGIGLYIVNEALERLKGHIKVESREGIGTTFHLTIPAMPAPLPKEGDV